MRVRAVLDQGDALASAERGDPLDVEGEVAADVDEEDGARAVLMHLALEVVERHAQVVAVAVDEFDARPGVQRGQRRRHERVRRAEHGLAGHAGPGQGGERRTGPPVEGHALDAVPARPRFLELGRERALAPAVGVEDPVPELVEPRPVTVVEADREPGEIGGDVRAEHRAEAYSGRRRVMSNQAF